MFPITEFDNVQLAFPTSVRGLMPEYKDIPDEFHRQSNKWVEFINHWFFKGLPNTVVLNPKEGVDANKAFKHVGYIMGSWEPKHEHKTAGCAYLLDQWFESYSGLK